jgi:hypothetical protein
MQVFHPNADVGKVRSVGGIPVSEWPDEGGSEETPRGVVTRPGNNRAVVEYAVMACSCSFSKAKQCANAIQAGANRVSSSCVALKDDRRVRDLVRGLLWPETYNSRKVSTSFGVSFAHKVPQSDSVP